MPIISSFYGIIITINFNDHNPPHFHAKYAEFEALIDIQTGSIMGGRLPPKAGPSRKNRGCSIWS